jgi:hypothetical protein
MSIEDRVSTLRAYEGCASLSDEKLRWFAYHTEVNGEFMGMYTSSMGTFISLSLAALGLSIAFREKVLGQKGPLIITKTLFGSWLCLMLTIALGTLYLYVAPKHVENRFKCSDFVLLNILSPGFIYGAALTLFVAGCSLMFMAILHQTKDA